MSDIPLTRDDFIRGLKTGIHDGTIRDVEETLRKPIHRRPFRRRPR